MSTYKTYHIQLKGNVGGPDFAREEVDAVLADNIDKPVNVLIESLGGSAATGISISNSFRLHGDVTVHFVGLNASAATVASLGAKYITIDAGAMYLVHKCSYDLFFGGAYNTDNIDELIAYLEKQKTQLEKFDVNIAALYAKRCKRPVNDLLDLMKIGGWLTAQEAKDWGFVDEITDAEEDIAARLTDELVSAMAANEMPIPNIPFAEKDCSMFAKFVQSLTSFFKNHNMDNETKTVDNTADLQSELDAANNKISELTAQITTLNDKITELEKAPADASNQVVNNAGSGKEPEECDFHTVMANAKSLMAEI